MNKDDRTRPDIIEDLRCSAIDSLAVDFGATPTTH